MRLQLLIQRHALPPVTIIHTTGSGPTSHTKSRSSTVADLLSDVNELVPLESSDGEWGLEDYVVEVAATGDQELTYECLHFQTLKSVLREDDEVLIRALSNDDLRVRRLGGRHQITGDGRHLIDGIPFGKRWLRQTTRPGMIIAPRKKRRLLPAEESVLETEEDFKRLLPAGPENHYDNITSALVPFEGDEDDDEEVDDDYVDDEEDDARDHVIVSGEFDDADVDEEDDSDLDDGLRNGDLSLDMKQLLEDAAEIEQTSNLAIASQVLETQLKRKRPIEDDGEHEHELDDLTFEGFSTAISSSSLPVNGFGSSMANGASDDSSDEDDGKDSLLDEIKAQQEEKRARNILQDDDDDSEDSDDSVVTDEVPDVEEEDDGGSDSMLDEVTAQQKEKRAKYVVEDDDDDSDDSDVTSSSGTSSSDSDAESLAEGLKMQQAKQRAMDLIGSTLIDEDETSSSGSDTDDDDEVSDATSSSGSDSDSDSDDSSESESDVPKSAPVPAVGTTERNMGPANKDTPPQAVQAASTQSLLEPNTGPNDVQGGIPFEGKPRTHQNNERGKRRRKLNALKRSGLLSPEADFQALTDYEERLERTGNGAKTQDQQEPVADRGVFDKTTNDDTPSSKTSEATTDEARTEQNKENVQPRIDDDVPVDEPLAVPTAPVPEIPETSQIDSQSLVEPSPKRARLDLASSRRLIFGSLGVRTPKNSEQEQKLREKLSQNVRQLKQAKEDYAASISQTPQPTPIVEDGDESWKNKLIVSAVECEDPGGILPPPPFPFQQGWAKPNRNKRKMRDQSQYYQDRSGQAPEGDAQATSSEFPTFNYDEQLFQTDAGAAPSKTTGSADVMPSEKEIENLPSLELSQIRPSATIAYQELHMDAATNYEPSVSPFRVGQVSQVDEDGVVAIQLAQSLYDSQPKQAFDEVTGERIYGKFEIADEGADQEDDGLREISFSSMIKPRLVKPALIQVPDSSHIAGLRGGDAPPLTDPEDVAVVPESAEQDATTQKSTKSESAMSSIDAPRKKEIDGIIKEAGFDSVLDEQLLQPIMNPISDDIEDPIQQDDDQDESYEKYAHRFRRRSPGGIITSSDPQPSSAIENEHSFDDDPADAEPTGVSSIPATSSPYMPTLNTVDYPHISQMELHSSEPVRTTNSSSHPDAQKLSPAPALGLSFTISEPEQRAEDGVADEAGDLADDDDVSEPREPPPISPDSERTILAPPESTPSAEEPEIEQTQFPQVTSDVVPSSPIPSPDNEGSSIQQNSFLGGPGYDGNDSSYHDSFDDNSSLPSLSDIISSQRTGRRTSRRTSSRLTKQVSSPVVVIEKSVRTSTTSRRKKKSPTPRSSADLPSSQIEFKASQSQRSQPRLSQIPVGSQLIDLTFSSDPMSPIKSSVEDKQEDDDSDYVVSQRKNKNTIEVKSTSRRTGGRAATKQTSQDSGIGKRTLLTKKRSSEKQYY